MKAIVKGISLTLTLTLTLTLCVSAQENPWEDNSVKVSAGTPKEKYSEFDYDYGPWSVSTNLVSWMRNTPYGRRITIEPEYQFTRNVSLKVPISFGVERTVLVGQRINEYPNSYRYEQYVTDVNTLPPVSYIPETYYQAPDVLFMVGFNPKFYFNGKSEEMFAFYGSVALNVGLADQYSLSYFDRLDTVSGYQGELYWDMVDSKSEYQSHQYICYNYELLFGMDINFSRRITGTIETGVSSNMMGNPERKDFLYAAIGNGNYVNTYTGPFQTYQYWNRYRYRLRFLLTYRI